MIKFKKNRKDLEPGEPVPKFFINFETNRFAMRLKQQKSLRVAKKEWTTMK